MPQEKETRLKELRADEFKSFVDHLREVAQERTVTGIYEALQRYIDTLPHVGCFGVWLAEDEEAVMADELQAEPSQRRLRLDFSAGTRSDPEEWLHEAGDYTMVPFTEPIVGAVAGGERQVVAADTNEWERPAWAVERGFVAYAASPLILKGTVAGVVATFFTRPLGAEFKAVLIRRHYMASDYIGSALFNAHAFLAIDRLRKMLELENRYLRKEVTEAHAFGEIIGESQTLQRVMEQVELVAATDANVLIIGESGTGKELIARAIHRKSPRKGRPLIKVNCSAIPGELFESEFFGHVKGAFTGAIKDRVGRFQLANRSTLLLDEVGEIPQELQGKLLRVLQEGVFERIGEDKSREVDVRIIAATNRDLEKEIERGRFRQDLYFRLSVFPVHLPPLRERIEDIPHLVQHFATLAARRLNLPEPVLKYRHIMQLQSYDWPGNVRELQNVVERAVILGQGGTLNFDHLPTAGAVPLAAELACPYPAPDNSLDRVVTEHEWRRLQKKNIQRALEETGWRIQGEGGAAELLGIKPTTLQSRIKKYGIKRRN